MLRVVPGTTRNDIKLWIVPRISEHNKKFTPLAFQYGIAASPLASSIGITPPDAFLWELQKNERPPTMHEKQQESRISVKKSNWTECLVSLRSALAALRSAPNSFSVRPIEVEIQGPKIAKTDILGFLADRQCN
ncbi:hypothetical protein Tcan_04069 [Toxocara canis]|uniref:Uncharacterized protein n=1 Tax=Toxocara canis TaxID=6265 RepID=A0A0B2VZB4_TOXCA|nr:hypothetical protein Tcan_04069 [Toxocara canis]